MALSAAFSPFRAFGSWYVSTAQKHPFATAFWTSGIKTSAADLIAQKVVEKKEELDWTRHLAFVGFGFFYLGGVQYYLYNKKFVQWCAGITNQVGHVGVAPLKTLMDQGIHHPFIYFPCFFLTKSLVEQRPHPLEHTYNKWRNEIWDSCKALWTLWVPGQIINFAFVPRHLRVPFAAGVSFAWCIVLSLMQGSADAKEAEEAAQGGDSKVMASTPLERPAWGRPCLSTAAATLIAAYPGLRTGVSSCHLQPQQPPQRQMPSLLPATHPAAALMSSRPEGFSRVSSSTWAV